LRTQFGRCKVAVAGLTGTREAIQALSVGSMLIPVTIPEDDCS